MPPPETTIRTERELIPPAAGNTVPGWLTLYLVFVGVGTMGYGLQMVRGMSNFIVGDWLINYSGGFVRRGLIGAGVLAVSHATRLPLGWTVYAVQCAVLVPFLVCVFWLARGLRWSYLMAAVMLSPAGIGFSVMDPYAGMRKEMLVFLSFVALLCVLVRACAKDWQLSALLAGMGVVLVLAHESQIVCAPYFFAAIAIYTGSLRRALAICWPAALVSGVALVAVALHPGNKAIAAAVCHAVGGTLGPWDPASLSLCGGSIAWLQFSLGQARQIFLPAIAGEHFLRWYGLLIVPAFAPVCLEMLRLYRKGSVRSEVRTIALCGLISLVGMGLLCYSALDWGRWIHMQIVCLTLLVVFVLKLRPAAESPRKEWSPQWRRNAARFAVVLYAMSWTLPSIDPYRGDGIVGLVRGWVHTVHHYHDRSRDAANGAADSVALPTS